MAVAPAYVEIAKRLQGLRDALDLSSEELAGQTGFPREKIELFESGTVEIPVSYLFEVSKASGVDLTVLISGKEAHLHNYSLVRKGKGMNVDRREDYDYKSLAYRFAESRMEPFLVTVPPKEEKDLVFNEHPGQEFIYILRGRLEIRLGEDVLHMEEGDSLYFTSRTPHALRGLDGKEAKFLDVIV
ncbi:MAG: helix-turn-helix domain-containing protein [Desulfonatronovibrionaceae bacterium]